MVDKNVKQNSVQIVGKMGGKMINKMFGKVADNMIY